jgi:hypothetical protein
MAKKKTTKPKAKNEERKKKKKKMKLGVNLDALEVNTHEAARRLGLASGLQEGQGIPKIRQTNKRKIKPLFGFNIDTLSLGAKRFNEVGDFSGNLHECYKPGAKKFG